MKKSVSTSLFMSRTCDLYGLNELLYGGRVEKRFARCWSRNYISCVRRNLMQASLHSGAGCVRESKALLLLAIPLNRSEDKKKTTTTKLKGKAIGWNETHKVLAYFVRHSGRAYLLCDLNLFLTFYIRRTHRAHSTKREKTPTTHKVNTYTRRCKEPAAAAAFSIE